MYIPDAITQQNDYQQCVSFHGHTCMGVTIGYLAAKLGLELLEIERAVDEEMVAIVENDACCCDAIQVLTGCTFGKGNFFFKDHGKMAFTFGKRETNQAFRLVLKQDVLTPPEAERNILEKIRAGHASTAEIKQYERDSQARIDELFKGGPQAFFEIQESDLSLPPKATIRSSMPCDSCGEMVMQTRLYSDGNRQLCKRCLV
jgi:formylmethanofuran dehydrogenase subunit E